MKNILFILLVGFAASAFAKTEQDHTCQGGHNCNEGGVGEQSQDQGQTQEQGQTQTQLTKITTEGGDATGGDATVGDVTTSVKVEGQKYRNSPGIFLSNPQATSPCRIPGSAGISVFGGALGIGGSKEDPECTLRETARFFSEFGEKVFAIQLLCTSVAVKRGGMEKACGKLTLIPVVVRKPVVEALLLAEVSTEEVWQIAEEVQQRTERKVDKEKKELEKYLRVLQTEVKGLRTQRALQTEQDNYRLEQLLELKADKGER